MGLGTKNYRGCRKLPCGFVALNHFSQGSQSRPEAFSWVLSIGFVLQGSLHIFKLLLRNCKKKLKVYNNYCLLIFMLVMEKYFSPFPVNAFKVIYHRIWHHVVSPKVLFSITSSMSELKIIF